MNSFKDSALFVRVRKGNTIDCLFVTTNNFIKKSKNYYSLNNAYVCNSFEITENVGGDVFIKTHTRMQHSKVAYTNEIKIERESVEEMRIESIV